MYDLGPELDHATVEPGTNLLVAGPPLTGKRRLALEILAAGANAGEGTIVVATQHGADRVLGEFRVVLDHPEAADVGVVDCVTRHQGRSANDTGTVRHASSPADMTGIGIKFSEFVEEFHDARGLRQNRVLLESLSTLLMYADLQTVFRFVHVFSSRIEDADALGVYVLESTAHETETVNTLRQLFDGVVETDEDDSPAVRLPGRNTGVAGR